MMQVVSIFIILEPIWMLLPFAGFLYGSVLRIEMLNKSPATAWLTHFVFPVLTGGMLGPALILIGFGIFLVGAAQIYWSKFRCSGLVSNGLYRFVRHPQYIALTLFGVGILLTWGRTITFISFFLMMYLYYFLTGSEERICIRLFGDVYMRYRERTSYIIPGDRYLRPLFKRLSLQKLPAPARAALAFLFTVVLCFSLMWLIQLVKHRQQQPPHLTFTVVFEQSAGGGKSNLDITSGEAGGFPYAATERIAVVRGPYRNAAVRGFSERVLLRIRESAALKNYLSFLNEPDGDVAVIFCTPFKKPDEPGRPGMEAAGVEGRGPNLDPAGSERVRLMIFRCEPLEGASITGILAGQRKIKGACFAPVNLGRAEDEDIVEGKLFKPGRGFPGEERWANFKKLVAEQMKLSGDKIVSKAEPGKHAQASLVLVKGPILRTRRDKAFAQELLDRLLASETFQRQMQQRGAGGNVVIVAFPRPGPNWYSEHHGVPQISFFVMSAVLAQGRDVSDIFQRDQRTLEDAFMAEMDFKINPRDDSVTEIKAVGLRRDLEERWRFFLSGI